MFWRLLTGVTGLLLTSGLLSAAGVEMDMSSCSNPVPFTPHSVPGAGSTECFISNAPIFRFDFIFTAPPTPTDVTCVSALFSKCSATENLGITDVELDAGSAGGIAASEVFLITLSGFTPGQTITEIANIPEPRTFWLLLSAFAAAAFSVWLTGVPRGWRRDTPATREAS